VILVVEADADDLRRLHRREDLRSAVLAKALEVEGNRFSESVRAEHVARHFVQRTAAFDDVALCNPEETIHLAD